MGVDRVRDTIRSFAGRRSIYSVVVATQLIYSVTLYIVSLQDK